MSRFYKKRNTLYTKLRRNTYPKRRLSRQLREKLAQKAATETKLLRAHLRVRHKKYLKSLKRRKSIKPIKIRFKNLQKQQRRSKYTKKFTPIKRKSLFIINSNALNRLIITKFVINSKCHFGPKFNPLVRIML